MKCNIPQISWHNRDPIFSIAFQPGIHNVLRLASCGTDSHIFIWHLSHDSQGQVNIEFAADLERHTNSVNVVRFSKPDGELLASADCEGVIYLWRQSEKEQIDQNSENSAKETWQPIRTLRAHLDDICDLAWASNGRVLASASVDNSAILWDPKTGKKLQTFQDAQSFVQGITIDPLNKYVATLSSDRFLRFYSIRKSTPLLKINKLKLIEGGETKSLNLFHGNTLRSFSRRVTFSPDGKLLFCPAGIFEESNDQIINALYVFTRNNLKRPTLYYPLDKKSAIVVSCCPQFFKLRNKISTNNQGSCSLFGIPYRIIFAVLTQSSVFLFDTQQPRPFAYIKDIHYAELTDLAWSPNGRILTVSSIDGYCSVIVFDKGDLGEEYEDVSQSTGEEDWNLILEPSTEEAEEPMDTSIAADNSEKPEVNKPAASILPKHKTPPPSKEPTKPAVNTSGKAPRRIQLTTLSTK